ncbi:hypothetical protein Sjap_017220 [Stephania japonica]|uniref:Uncharacterized protein n=1 Tax=Stephania japonica TaxID=461633 RepID=A0AAP0I5S0_9MAGN
MEKRMSNGDVTKNHVDHLWEVTYDLLIKVKDFIKHINYQTKRLKGKMKDLISDRSTIKSEDLRLGSNPNKIYTVQYVRNN